MGHPTEKATNISAEDFSSSDPITPSGPHHQQSASEPGRVSSSTSSAQTPSHSHHHNQKGILNRLPDYFRDTVDWFIGYAFVFINSLSLCLGPEQVVRVGLKVS
ncbi:hypothetical protein L5515_018925 [Caenorhabditis briggsae]|uniref:Uncharacterized protein n=1 Tax=Caenorhabditis briggsae TaxID=6238 RepID=A0AAE9FKI2_CAEBR|nr:hypothetical protein L3Y34_013077 [Caenorhabditis briggsae]UMM43432.1 hypothetical protein L5515_018925 [Caenorhabditis briggsae]